jgi:predicted GTPase
LTAHQERLEKERRMNALKRKMEARRKQLEEVQIFALLAKEDESMKELFEEFLDLQK